jgi:hypothetical protein
MFCWKEIKHYTITKNRKTIFSPYNAKYGQKCSESLTVKKSTRSVALGIWSARGEVGSLPSQSALACPTVHFGSNPRIAAKTAVGRGEEHDFHPRCLLTSFAAQ